MLNHIRQYRYFYLPTFAFICFGFILRLVISKGDAVLLADNWGENAKYVFLYITKLAEIEGVVALSCITLLFGSRRQIAIFIVASLLALAIAQSLKHFVFPEYNRPQFYIDQLQDMLPFKRNLYHSFPSGHTTAAFAMFGSLALMFSKNWFHFSCAVLAALVGLSRIALGQHFLEDVVTGMVLGTFIIMWVRLFFDRHFDSEVWHKRLIQR